MLKPLGRQSAIADQAHKNANAEQIKQPRTHLAQDLERLNFRVWLPKLFFYGCNLRSK